MSAAYQQDETRSLVVAATAEAGWNENKIAIIKEQLAPGIDDANLAFFAATCARVRLDPVMKQIYIIGRNSRQPKADGGWEDGKKWTIQVGIDGLQLIASRTEEWAGVDLPTFGPMVDGHPEWAAITVYRFVKGQRVPFSAVAYFDEYAQYKDEYANNKKTGNKVLTGKWVDMPRNQLTKCARAQAIRMGFPAETSGVYANEEMEQADNTPLTVPTSLHIVEAAPAPVQRAPRAVTPMANATDGQVSMQKLFERSKTLGISAADWTAFKRECGNDPQRISAALDQLEEEGTVVPSAIGEASLEGQGLFGTRGS